MPPKLTPQVPGQSTQPTAEPITGQAGDPTLDPTLPQSGAAGEETVVVSKADLAALMNRLTALEQKPAAAAARVAPNSQLPDQTSVNPDKIKTPVLTKQGWVVPTTFGANPAQKAL